MGLPLLPKLAVKCKDFVSGGIRKIQGKAAIPTPTGASDPDNATPLFNEQYNHEEVSGNPGNLKGKIIKYGGLGVLGIVIGIGGSNIIFDNLTSQNEIENTPGAPNITAVDQKMSKEVAAIVNEIKDQGGSVEKTNPASLQSGINYSLNRLDELVLISSFKSDSIRKIEDDSQLLFNLIGATIKDKDYSILYSENTKNNSTIIMLNTDEEGSTITKGSKAKIITLDSETKKVSIGELKAEQFQVLLDKAK